MSLDTLTIDEVIDTFELMDDWEERYRYLIELGRRLPPFPESARTETNRVRGCVSQVWLLPHAEEGEDGLILNFEGDSDAHIVRGLIAVLMLIYSGQTPAHIARTDARPTLEKLGLAKHLSPMRTNGLWSMVGRIREIGKASIAVA